MPTSRNIDQKRFHALMSQISALLWEWAEKLDDRKTPLGVPTIAAINRVLEQAQKMVSREAGFAYVRPLPQPGPVTPGDAFVALLQASTALLELARNQGIPLPEGGEEDSAPF